MSAAPAERDVLLEFADAIRGVAASLLDPYIEHLEYLKSIGMAAADAKEVNDAVWGTIVVEPLEILVLDSPLLQRLRQIKQLGVVHLVYPSGGHTRFEHSLGALQQVTRVIEALNTRSAREEPLVRDETRKVLRLAALCHDVGHGLMSHVSENALDNFDLVHDLRLQFGKAMKVEKPPLSEISAYYMLGSDSFRVMITLAEDILRDTSLPENAADQIRDAIVGKKISDEIPLLHELISGPFDADKLDYMTRDAMMTGVPVVTDIPRLVQKVRAIELPLNELPRQVQRQVPQGLPGYWITGIHISGDRTLDELLIGRALLFDKLYRHHKVRACEAMVAGIFRELGHLVPHGPALLPYALDDAQLLELDHEQIEKLRGVGPLEGTDRDRASVAVDLARRLRLRRLFVRAYAFAQNMPLDPYRGDRSHTAGLREFGLDCADPVARGMLVEDVAVHVERILETIGMKEPLKRLPTADIKPYVWIDPPRAPTGATKVAAAYLISSEGKPLRFGEESAEAPSWTNAYLLTSDIGYVFTIPELAPYVFLATERVVREKYAVRTPRSMYGYAKQLEKDVDAIRERLADAGYYADAPADIRPLPPRLKAGDIPGRIQGLQEKLSGYEGPVRAADLKEEKKIPLARERVENWLRQFEDDDLIDAGLQVLERLSFVGRYELVKGLDEFLKVNPVFHGGSIAPFGEPKDSSAILTYEAQDAGAAYGLTIKPLEQALGEGRPIVFVDDFIGSGQQSVSIIEAWLEQEPTTQLKEVRSPLKPALQELLRNTPIAFVFSAGTLEGAEALRVRCADIGLDAKVAVVKTDLPTVFDPGFENDEHRDRFVARCREVARELLINETENHDAEWAEDRLVGYGNGGYLILFPYNTPTQTLTVLWESRRGLPWEPLFPRRKKR